MCSHGSLDWGSKPGTYECQDCEKVVEWRVDGEGEEYLAEIEPEDDSCSFCGAPPDKQEADWRFGCPDCGAELKPVPRESYSGPADPDITW